MIRKTLLAGFAVCLLGLAGMNLAAGRADVADAMMKRDKVALRSLLQQKADVNASQPDGATALHWAVYQDDLEAVDLLIKAGAKVDAANREGVTPLNLASLYGDAKIIDRLLKAGANAKQKGPAGETMVMLAARNGNPEAITLLVSAGADVNAREPIRGTTALMWAVEQKHPAAVAALLDAKADFAAKSSGAGLPRNYMAQRVNTAAVETAVKRWAEAAKNGRTYEQQLTAEGGGRNRGFAGFAGFGGGGQGGQAGAAAAPPNIKEIAQQIVELAESFGVDPLDALPFFAEQVQGAGIDINALTAAIQQASVGTAQPAQQAPRGQQAAAGGQRAGRGARGQGGQAGGQARGASTATATSAGEDGDDTEVVVAGLVGSGGGGLTAMVLAAREGDLESTKLLLGAGANVNQVTEYGWSPLLTATNNRHYKLAEYLIEHGANVNLANKGSWTPLYLATDNRNIEGGDFPVSKADMDHLEYIKFLLDHGANPNQRVKDNTLTRTIFTMQWFFEAGATPFIRASQSGDTELMKLLVAHGADPMIKTEYGDTALTAAAGIGWVEGVTYEHSTQENVEAIKMLLDLGLDPNGANQDGRTPLMGAALKGRNAVVQLLVDRGAKLDQRDKGSRDTDKAGSLLAGHTWDALDYADGLVRVGVQSAVARPETAALIRKLMTDRGMKVPPPNRVVDSICVVEICKERVWN
jgi:uncharacterized protein